MVSTTLGVGEPVNLCFICVSSNKDEHLFPGICVSLNKDEHLSPYLEMLYSSTHPPLANPNHPPSRSRHAGAAWDVAYRVNDLFIQ